MVHSCCEQVDPPEECEQLLSAARRPGQIHAVVASIRGHHEATPAAGVSYSVVVDSKTGWNRLNMSHVEFTVLNMNMNHLYETLCGVTSDFFLNLSEHLNSQANTLGCFNTSVLSFQQCTGFFCAKLH